MERNRRSSDVTCSVCGVGCWVCLARVTSSSGREDAAVSHLDVSLMRGNKTDLVGKGGGAYKTREP